MSEQGLDTSPKETPLAYAAFLEYCALGRGRSLLKLAQKFGEDSGKIRSLERQYEMWSSRHKWQERVKQYDAERILERVERKQAKRDEMEERHAREAKEDQDLARKVIKQAVGDDGKVKGKISLAAVQLLKNSREDERKAIIEEEIPVFDEDGKGAVIGIAIYLPQKHALRKATIQENDESDSE